MKLSELQQRKGEGGFTLVELAIVMIIIGLLIGGILKGQELVANAQLTATVAQIKGIDAGISTFRDKYSAMPGDMANADARLRDCAAAPCSTGIAGNGAVNTLGNGRIDVPASILTAPALEDENARAFIHMAAADLIAGVDIAGTANFGSAMPEAKIGGGFWIGFDQDGDLGADIDNARPGQYLVLNGLVGDVAADSTTGITATQGGQIDRKMDDGNPDAGDVQATGLGCVPADNTYGEADVTASCSMFIRVQG